MRCALLCLLLSGCAHRLVDDLPRAPLAEAIDAEIPLLPARLKIGEREFSRDEYAAALRQFAALLRAGDLDRVREHFDLVDAGEHLVTSYYEPTIDGARHESEKFSQALYALPPGGTNATRAQIDGEGALSGRGLELAWVDPVDAWVLQIEGSGVVILDDGTRLALDYGGNNGHAYVRLAPLLKQLAPDAAVTGMHAIEAYLHRITPAERRALLDKNPRYVFFKPRTGSGPRTSMQAIATDGRTIATDRARPKGALAWLETTQPRFEGDSVVPKSWVPLRRFVLDQDTGSAIVGARVDLYWGSGPEARRSAGVMKQRGRLYYLVPKRATQSSQPRTPEMPK